MPQQVPPVAGELLLPGAVIDTASAPDGSRALVIRSVDGQFTVVVPMDPQAMAELGTKMAATKALFVPTGAQAAHVARAARNGSG